MNCSQFQHSLADYISGELSPGAHAEAQRHAAECRACADELAGLQSAAAVLDSGRLRDAAGHAEQLRLPAAPLSAPHRAGRQRIPSWMRYAAVIALAFTGGYVLRGSAAAQAPLEPRIVGIQPPAGGGVVERYNSIARERPNVTAFSRSLLAVAAPATK